MKPVIIALQWGRRLLATERRGRQIDAPGLLEASMGPSPLGDGKMWEARLHP